MATARDLASRPPVLTYYVLTFAISYGSILLVIGGPGNCTGAQAQVDALTPIAVLALFAGSSLSGRLSIGLVGGRAGYRDLFSRLLRWRVELRRYAVAPLVLAAVPLALSLLSPAFLPAILATSDGASLLAFGIGWGRPS